jgi:hypothetical protein
MLAIYLESVIVLDDYGLLDQNNVTGFIKHDQSDERRLKPARIGPWLAEKGVHHEISRYFGGGSLVLGAIAAPLRRFDPKLL